MKRYDICHLTIPNKTTRIRIRIFVLFTLIRPFLSSLPGRYCAPTNRTNFTLFVLFARALLRRPNWINLVGFVLFGNLDFFCPDCLIWIGLILSKFSHLDSFCLNSDKPYLIRPQRLLLEHPFDWIRVLSRILPVTGLQILVLLGRHWRKLLLM